MKTPRTNAAAFTVVEMLVVPAILAVLVPIGPKCHYETLK
jgi:Tfp pilus assembly protein FimT